MPITVTRPSTLLRRLADAYEAAPTLDINAIEAWEALGVDSVRFADKLRAQYEVHYVSGQPYASVTELLHDLKHNLVRVSTENCDHPVWYEQTNLAFRLVHDVCGHGLTGGDFTWAGEMLACYSHARFVRPVSRPALRTECLGQVAYQQIYGGFGCQKVAIL